MKENTKMTTMIDFNPLEQDSHQHFDSKWKGVNLHIYFLLVSSVIYLPSTFTISTLSIYNTRYEGYLYSFYSELASNIPTLFFPFVIPYFRKIHFSNQNKIVIFSGYLFSMMLAIIGLIFPHSKAAFYTLLLLRFISIVICYAGQTCIIDSFKFSPEICIPFFYTGFPGSILLMSIVLLPLNYFEVSQPVIIVSMCLIMTFIFLYAFILQNHLCSDQHYISNMKRSEMSSRETPIKETLAEVKGVARYFFLLLICTVCFGAIYPTITIEYFPKSIGYLSYSNIVTIVCSGIMIVSNFIEIKSLSKFFVQATITGILLFYTILQALWFTFTLAIPGWIGEYSWVITFVFGGLLIIWNQGYTQRYCMKKAIKKSPNREVPVVIASAIFIGFFIGSSASLILAEVRKAKMGKDIH